MPRQWPLFNVIVYALLSVPAAAQQQGIHWQQDIETAKAQAKHTGRLVLVHFWMPNCGPCLSLEQNVFKQPKVVAAIEALYVPVKLNANENSATATAYGITNLPTDVVLTPDGQEVCKMISPPTPAEYIAELSQVATQYAARAGQSYSLAAAAPQPQQMNSAYAGLQIAPSTIPAAAAQLAGNAPDRYATPGQPAVAGTSIPSVTKANAPPTVPNTGYIPWGPPPQAAAPATAPAANGTQVGAAAAVAAAGAPAYNPYAQANPYALPAGATPNVAPQTAVAPAQTTNPYVAPPAGAQIATAASAMAPTIGPAQNTVVAAVAPDSSMSRPPDTRALPPGAAPLGFDGYCPVSMRTKWKWVPGDPRWGVMHRGRTYWFVSAGEQQQFLTDPDRFGPALSGIDPVLAFDHRQQVPGKREHSIDYDNIFYMFASEATLQQFAANPDRYATSARQAMGIPRGRLVR